MQQDGITRGKIVTALAVIVAVMLFVLEALDPGGLSRFVSTVVNMVIQLWEWACDAGRAILAVVRSMRDWVY